MTVSDKYALYREGVKLKDEKKYEEALAKLDASLAVDPNLVVAFHARVQCLTELGRHPEAIEMAQKIVVAEPDDYFAYIALTRAFQRAGMIPQAEMAMMQGNEAKMRAAMRR